MPICEHRSRIIILNVPNKIHYFECMECGAKVQQNWIAFDEKNRPTKMIEDTKYKD